METPVPQRTQSIGRALQSTSRGTHRTFSSSTRARSRCDMLAPDGCARLSGVKTYNVPGTVTGHRYHHSRLTSMGPGTKLQCQENTCMEPCAQMTAPKSVLVYSAPQAPVWNSMSLRSRRLPASSPLSKDLRRLCSTDCPCPTARNESRIRHDTSRALTSLVQVHSFHLSSPHHPRTFVIVM